MAGVRRRRLSWGAAAVFAMILGAAFPSRLLPQHADFFNPGKPWLVGFETSARHWYGARDDGQVVRPLPTKPIYSQSEVAGIADNVLLYQKANGGWPKNYDMHAILTEDQMVALRAAKEQTNTTIDNGATYSHVFYLAHAYSKTAESRYRDACLAGIDFLLSAQYPNGGWPQFHPETRGYRRYITFNDGAMIGVMRVLRAIARNEKDFTFVDLSRLELVRRAYRKGLECILTSQVIEGGVRTAWSQQHDEIDFRPRGGRTFEPAALTAEESAEIALFLMSLDSPDSATKAALEAVVDWFRDTAIRGIRVRKVSAGNQQYLFPSSEGDVFVVEDAGAPSIWARYYELETARPLFCNRDGKPVYRLEEVELERRTGYRWYTYSPQTVLREYPAWLRRWDTGGRRDLKDADTSPP